MPSTRTIPHRSPADARVELWPTPIAPSRRTRSTIEQHPNLAKSATTPWIAVALAAALMLLASSDRIMILYTPRLDIVLALALVLCTFSTRSSLSLCAVLFLTLSMIAGFRVGDAEWAIGRSLKLLLIWLGASQWRLYPAVHRTIFLTAVVAAFMNAVLVLLMFRGVSWSFGEISANGRMSTFLTMPGVLSRVGLVPLCYFLYRAIVATFPRAWDLSGIAACLLLIWRDGSRTGMLCVAACWLFVMGCLAWERRSAKLGAMLSASIAFGIVVPTIMWQFMDNDNPLHRIVQFLEDSANDGIAAGDSFRHELNATAMQMIAEDPFLGHGLGTARISSHLHEGGFEVVHNVYLQQFVECGLFGFLSITGVLWGWLPNGLKLLPQLRQLTSIHERAYYYNALYCLSTYGLMKLTHPLSSEWGDWMVFCYASAAVMGFSFSARPSVRNTARPSAQVA